MPRVLEEKPQPPEVRAVLIVQRVRIARLGILRAVHAPPDLTPLRQPQAALFATLDKLRPQPVLPPAPTAVQVSLRRMLDRRCV